MTFMERIASSFSEDEAFLILALAIFGVYVLFFITAFLIHHLLLAVPLCIMAEKAGYDYPFIAFIPFANYYLVHILPMKEYSFIGIYKTYERRHGFWIYLTLMYAVPLAVWAISIPLSFIPILSFLFGLLFNVLTLVSTVGASIARAIMYIDLIQLYMKKDQEGLSVFLGIASIFVFPMFPIICMVLCTKEPEFGYGNYYKPISMQRDYD